MNGERGGFRCLGMADRSRVMVLLGPCDTRLLAPDLVLVNLLYSGIGCGVLGSFI